MNLIDSIGYIAAMSTTFAYIPQAVKVIKTNDTRSLSLAMYFILTTGVGLWCVYGFIREDWPLAAANAITLIFSLLILVIKIKNNKVDSQVLSNQPNSNIS